MPQVLTKGLGIEELVDEIESVLRSELNPELVVVFDEWEAADILRAGMRGLEYIPITLEAVTADAFYAMNIPSLVREDVGPEEYPYVAIIPDRLAADAEFARQDQRKVYQQLISIHSLAKSSKLEGPEFAGRRAVRMANAVNNIVQRDHQLRFKLQGVANPMTVNVSEPFIFRPGGHGDEFYYQAAGLQYGVKNYI